MTVTAKKGSVVGGAAWMVAARFAERGLGFVSTMVLARLLAPSDFGLVAMAMVFVAAADVLGAFGLDWALVRQPGLERRHLDTAWTIRTLLGITSLIVLGVIAIPAADFYREPRIVAMICVLGVSLLVGAVENPGVIHFRRSMDFNKEFRLRTAAKVAGAVVAISTALLLRSYWALLFGTLASRFTATVMSYAMHPHRPRPTLAAREELLGFSIWLWLANILTFVRTRSVEMVLGRIDGPRDLGLFSVSNELSQLASTELAAPINRALFSAYAAQGDRAHAVGESYLYANPLIWLISLPIAVGTYLCASQVILLVLGANWHDSVPLLRTLAIAGFAGLLSSGAIHVYWAINRARLETFVEAFWVTMLLTLVLTLVPRRGVAGAAEAVLISNLALVPITMFLLRRFAGVSIRATMQRTWRVITACLVMYFVVDLVTRGWSPKSTSQAVEQLFTITVLGAAVYFGALYGLWRLLGRPVGPEADLLEILRSRFSRRVVGPPAEIHELREAAQDQPASGATARAATPEVRVARLRSAAVERDGQAEVTPTVSVIIPAYNDARFIGQAIGSVLAQTHRPLDVIVIDDGSRDDTAEIAESFGPPVRVFRQLNAGAAVARNAGMREARGDYIAFLDADDFWHPRKTEMQLHHLRHCRHCVAVYCNKVEFREDAAQPSWHEPDRVEDLHVVSSDPKVSGWLYLELLRASILHTSTLMAPRSVLQQVGEFDTSLRKGQDLDYWLRLSRLGPIHMLDSVLSAYRIHPASISHRAMSTNYHALVVERAVGRFGPADPAGHRLEDGELAGILGASWLEFAYQHFRAGAPRLCLQSLQRSLDYRPARMSAWRLRLRASVAAARARSS